jgi:hypothetical protein
VALFNVIKFVGAGGTTTSASGNTVTITSSASDVETLTGDTGGALSPTSNNFNIIGGVSASGTIPVQVNGAVSTLTVNVQRSAAIASTDANRVGLAAFNSAQFSVDANGFVSLVAAGPFVTSVSGTANRITSTGGTTPVIDISASYVGQSSITTLGTITTGVWHGSVIPLAFGGTNANLTANAGAVPYSTSTALALLAPSGGIQQILMNNATNAPAWSSASYPPTATQGDIIISTASTVFTNLAKNTTATRYLSNTGTNNTPAWAQVNIANGVTGILPIANGGTNANAMVTTNGLVKYDGTRLVTSSAATLDSGSVYTNTAQTAVYARLNNVLTNVTGDGTIIAPLIFDTVITQQGSAYSAVTGIFTAPSAGLYLINATVTYEDLTALHTSGNLIITSGTGTDILTGLFNPGASKDVNNKFTFSMSGLIMLNATNTIQVTTQVSGSTKTVDIQQANFGTFTYLYIVKLF